MPKTYNTIPQVATGDLLTATAWNNQATNVNNYRVPPMCRVQLSGNQSIANSTTKDLSFGTESVDTDGMFTATSSVITIQTAGIYLIAANVIFSPNAGGVRQVVITRNDVADATNNVIAGAFGAGSSTTNNSFSLASAMSLSVNDTLRLNVFQNTGGALNVLAGDYTFLSATWLGQVS